MESKNCTTCGQILKLIPAGVSKATNKPYNAFYVCPDKHPQPKPGFTSQVNTNAIANVNEDAKWKKINEEKNGNIKWMNALNNAFLLIAHGKVELKDAKVTAQRIYEMSPLGTTANKEKPAELPIIQQDEWLPEKIEDAELNNIFGN